MRTLQQAPSLPRVPVASPLARLRATDDEWAVTAAGVWAATFLCFLAIGAALPVLPRYVKGPIGAGDLSVGIVVGCFALAAIVGRPLGGRLADARGRRPVVVIGLLVSAVAGAMYLLPLGVPGLVAARLVLGVGDGWVFTAGATWVIDLAPDERRGQAIGLFGLAIWAGLTVGPIAGELLLAALSYEAVWAFCTITPALGALVALRLPEAHVAPPRPAAGAAPLALIPRPVVEPGLALLLANVGYGTMAGFVVLHLADRGIGGGATVFVAFAAAVVVTRLALGTLPDRLGPRRTAAAAGVAETVGLVVLAVAPSFPVAVLGGVVMGAGFSLLFPSLALIAVARVGPERRGAALGAFTAFFDAGVGIGAPLAGAIAAVAGYAAAFWTAAAAAALGVVMSVASSGRAARRAGGDVAG